jgi:CRISPR-associated endonuclease/helicase Cas3
MTTSLEVAGQTVPFFREITGFGPYPWQRRLFRALTTGAPPASLDIPTGLGKSSAVLLYLLGLAQGAPLPRRVVYVVDRRAIVDQTAAAIRVWVASISRLPELAERFDRLAAFPAPTPVALGVIRGGLADDGEWRVDPARAAVIVGTVDMIGSRLLFSGYGDGLSRRAFHAGLLGHDTFLMLDEAHLSPGMARLIREIAGQTADGERPGFRALTLSATPDFAHNPFGLDDEDLADTELSRRFLAEKTIRLDYAEDNAKRAERIAEIAARFETGSVLIFTRTVRDARKIHAKLAKHLGRNASDRLGLLTGTLRGAEREALGTSALWAAFDPARAPDPAAPTRYLVSTSAGEVGVDLDADHAVMDLAPLDAMIQRLGRVNRTGRGSARVHVVRTEKEGVPLKAKKNQKYSDRLAQALYQAREALSELQSGSPYAVRAIPAEARLAALAPRAEPVPLHAATVESFAATTARLAMPPLDLFLRGLSDEPAIPDTHILWRWDVPDLVAAGEQAAAEAIAMFRPEPREIARVPSGEARELLTAALSRRAPLPLLLRNARGEVSALELEPGADLPEIAYATLFLPTDAGGLRAGLPDPGSAAEVRDVGDSDERLRRIVGDSADPPLPPWVAKASTLRIPLHDPDDEDTEARWLLYALRGFDPAVVDADSDLTRLGAVPQTLEEHGARVAAAARRIGEALGLSADLTEALETAGRWHDSGKGRRVWQRATGVPASAAPMAKSREGRFQPRALGGYRHEFGSLADAERNLSPGALNELALHLIAAHHGRARPGFPDPRHWDPDLPAELGEDTAQRVAERFARLQGEYGPWQLAWLEALVKAADAWVSANRDA